MWSLSVYDGCYPSYRSSSSPVIYDVSPYDNYYSSSYSSSSSSTSYDYPYGGSSSWSSYASSYDRSYSGSTYRSRSVRVDDYPSPSGRGGDLYISIRNRRRSHYY